jgi:hypothetical protein
MNGHRHPDTDREREHARREQGDRRALALRRTGSVAVRRADHQQRKERRKDES